VGLAGPAASAKQVADVTGEVDGGFDLDLAVGEALQVDAEWQAKAATPSKPSRPARVTTLGEGV
jgi:hypothetical protein